MKESITADRIANSIIQRKDSYKNFILVEGTHDRLFFLKFKNEKSQIEITFGWEKLLTILEKLKQRGYNNAIGIIDRDLKFIIPEDFPQADNLVLTDDYDLNIMCMEKTFSTIFDSHCSEEKVKNFKTKTNLECINTHTQTLAIPLSYLRILNKRENLNLTFKSKNLENKLDYSKFIDKNHYNLISLEKLVETITNFSRSKTQHKIVDDKLIVEKLKKLMHLETYHNSKIVNGHDFGEIICLGLKKALGSLNIESDTFLKETILAYDYNDFKQTAMYSEITKVESKYNTEYIKK